LLRTANPPQSKSTKEIYCTCKQGKAVKIKKLFRLELQTHYQAKAQRKSIAHQIGKAAKDKEAVTLFCF
jgi:hypothetical protein